MKVVLATLMMVSMVCAATDHSDYIPVRCMGRVVITTFGKCQQIANGRVRCPHTDLSFEPECVSAKKGDTETIKMRIEIPTVLELEKETN
jgi:hypothetical protein